MDHKHLLSRHGDLRLHCGSEVLKASLTDVNHDAYDPARECEWGFVKRRDRSYSVATHVEGLVDGDKQVT